MLGVLLTVCAFGHLISASAGMVGLYGLQEGWPLAIIRSLGTLITGAWQIGLAGLFPIALLLFPDGRLLSRRWRLLVVGLAVCMSYQLLTGILSTGSPFDTTAFDSILSIGLEPEGAVNEVFGYANLAGWLLVIVALVLRYRRGDGQVQRQLLWLILAVLTGIAINAQRFVTAEGPILLLLSFVLVPIAVGIAIVRHQLLDIRLVLSRALLYGLTIAAIIAGYAGIVAALSLVVSARAERGVAIIAAIMVAIAFNPVRLLIQRMIEQAFYGTRADPAKNRASGRPAARRRRRPRRCLGAHPDRPQAAGTATAPRVRRGHRQPGGKPHRRP